MLSLPDRGTAVETAVRELWDDLQIVDDAADLAFLKKKPQDRGEARAFRRRRGARGDPRGEGGNRGRATGEAGRARGAARRARGVRRRRARRSRTSTRAACPTGSGGVRRAATGSRPSSSFTGCARSWPWPASRGSRPSRRTSTASTRPTSSARSSRSRPQWFPAVENRGEGIFFQLRADAVKSWLERPGVQAAARRPRERAPALAGGPQEPSAIFPGGPYVLLHTLSHLLIQSLAMRCGYPASSIRERIYAD